jgi:glucose-6-phosphate isomerase
MGGSSLGAKALLSVFGPAEGVRIHILDTIEPEAVSRIFSSLDMKSTLFNVITKSGKTLETLVMLHLILRRLDENGLDPKERIVITTGEAPGNELYQWAGSRGIRTLPFPHGVEGRYSVLSSVGLFPALYMYCNPEEILKGAEPVARSYFTEGNEPLAFAAKSVAAIEEGMDAHVFLTYSSPLRETGDWFAQLWAESLGKNGNGQIPVTAVGPSAQHSQLQLYLDGPKRAAISLVGLEKHKDDIVLEGVDAPLRSLGGKRLFDILRAEMDATGLALAENEVFSRTILLEKPREKEIGGLLMFLEMATAHACYLVGVNPYDQPAVEEGKRHARDILGL